MKNGKYYMSVLFYTGFIFAILVGTTSCGDTPGPVISNIPVEKNGDVIGAGNDANDISFLVHATGINLEEIRLGEVAQEKGTTKDIRELGKMMVTQHTKVQSDLTALATRKNITIPTMMSDNASADYNKLNSMAGNDFNMHYANMMVEGHKAAITLFEKESTGAIDPDIRQWAVAVLPGLHTHLDHARACQVKLAKM